MEIQDRLFSETSGERYYSVLMNEEEYSLYSGWSDFLRKVSPNLDKLKRGLEKAAREIAYIGESPGSKVVTKAVKQQPGVVRKPKKPDIPAYWKRST